VEPGDDIDGHRAALDLDDLRSEALRYRDEPGRLRALLDDVAREESRLKAVAARSSYHPNGFVKIALERGRTPRLRLHVWPRGKPVRTSDPHGHRWPFASWIITGTLQEVVFVETAHGDRFDVYDYRGTSRTPAERPSRSTTLARLPPRPRRAGTVYTRASGELHIADPATDDLVATLVLQGTDAHVSTPVHRRPGQSEPRPGPPVSPDELRGLLLQVSGVLEPA
jgi:hypothetical protein